MPGVYIPPRLAMPCTQSAHDDEEQFSYSEAEAHEFERVLVVGTTSNCCFGVMLVLRTRTVPCDTHSCRF